MFPSSDYGVSCSHHLNLQKHRISFVLQSSVHVLYFFVTDCFATNEVTMKYCPTESMIADFFTKTLQGATFQKFRDQIMNADLDAPGLLDHSSAL